MYVTVDICMYMYVCMSICIYVCIYMCILCVHMYLCLQNTSGHYFWLQQPWREDILRNNRFKIPRTACCTIQFL